MKLTFQSRLVLFCTVTFALFLVVISLVSYRLLAQREGVFGEPASAAGVAGLLQASAAGQVAPGSVVVCTITGHGLKDPDTAVAGARKRVSGERWYWGRTSAAVDVSPLVALTLAFDLSVSRSRRAEPGAFWA